MAHTWSPQDIGDQTGRRVVVSGAGSGVGRATALDLAARGAELVLADADLDALADVVRHADAVGSHRPSPVWLDLGDLDSVREAAGQVLDATGGRVDALVVDGGRPGRASGSEQPLVEGVLGPFLLVARLWSALAATSRARVVTVVPPGYRLARELSALRDGADPESPDGDADDAGGSGLLRRTALGAPAEAALASMVLALELAERAREPGRGFRSLAAVAGIDPSSTVTAAVERTERLRRGRAGSGMLDAALGALGQRSEAAHLPVLMAVTADLPGATVVGLGGALGLGTAPRIVNPPRAARDRALRRQLWDLACRETGEQPG